MESVVGGLWIERMFEDERLPVGLAELQPGPELAALLAVVDRDRLPGYDRVDLLQARSRQVAHDQAEMHADMVAVAESVGEELSSEGCDLAEIEDSAASEIRACLVWTRRAAESQLGFARDLCQRLPQVWRALDAGLIDLPRARVIVNQTLHLDSELAERVADQALEQASTQTTGQLRARIQQLCITMDPESAKHRYEEGLKERLVAVEANNDGTAGLYGMQLPAADTHAAMRRINLLARAARSKDDPRSMDQIRADVFLDLLNGRHQQHSVDGTLGGVELRVDLTTLAGLAEDPGELAGYGPVIADIARQVTDDQGDSPWRWTVTDPETGAVIDSGTTRRRPTAGLKRHIQSRNPTCVFPGCRMPSVECDLDHNHPWAHGGATNDPNLGPLCRHDHQVKERGWKIIQPRPGFYQWTSPLGHSYTVGPGPP
ncbi:MAG TPA: DUF222 domain-containing protein [Acidimicrobiia bacterium]|nr:DUF222 domain-containing protein [Acidimicrobiia bacterium]